MIRLVLGSALPVLGLGAAAALLGPDLLTGPRGEPLILVAADQAILQPASFNGEACVSMPVFSAPSETDQAGSGIRVFAFTLPADTDNTAVAVEDFPRAGAIPKTVVLVFDKDGRIVAAGDPLSLQVQAAMALADCIEAPEPDSRAPI